MIIDRIYKWARERPDRTAIIRNGVPVPYAQFARAIERTRKYLEHLGLPERTASAVLIEDLTNCWTVCIALRALGLDVITATAAQQIHELAVRNLSCFVMLEGDKYAGEIPPPGTRHIVVPASLYADLDSNDLPVPIETEGRYGGHIVYTSGTTGTYKKLLWPAAGEDRRTVKRTQVFRVQGDFVINNIAFPSATAAGYWNPMAAWYSGCCVVFDQTKDFVANLFRFGVARVVLVPLHLRFLPTAEQAPPAPPREVEPGVLVYAGGFLPRICADWIVQNLTPKLQFNYTSTETIDIALLSMYRTTEDLVWLPINGDNRVEIVDEEGRLCGTGQEGRLRVGLRDTDIQGYLDDPEATRRAYQDGFFYPGDHAVSRADGRIRILGRINDVINLHGNKVPVAPIEQDLRDYLQVDEVCLFLRSNDASEEVLDVAIQCTSVPSPERLSRVRREFPLIAHVDFHIMTAFPRTATGKVQRAMLNTTLRAPKDATD